MNAAKGDSHCGGDFFPITVGLLDGFGSADKDMINLMRSMGAGEFQIFRYIKLPGAMSHFFASLRISVSYSVVGAVISEWLGGFSGLGVYMTRVKKAFAYDKMFAVIFSHFHYQPDSYEAGGNSAEKRPCPGKM